MPISSLCGGFTRRPAHRLFDELDLLDVVLRRDEPPHRGTVGNSFEHVLAHAIRHFGLEEIFLDYAFFDESFFDGTRGGVGVDALPNRQNAIIGRATDLSHAVVDRPTHAENHQSCYDSGANEVRAEALSPTAEKS
jgi:hypothetical protein